MKSNHIKQLREIRPKELNNKFVFHHIPKCGGTSVLEVLKNWFDIILDYRKGWSDKYPQKYRISEIHNQQCICGHFELDGNHIFQRYPEIQNNHNFKIFSFIRNPLSTQISLYKYETINHVSTVDNITDHLFLRKNYISSILDVNIDNYADYIDRYFFVGILEYAQESIDILAKILNKNKLKLKNINSTSHIKIQNIKQSVIDDFANNNKLDYLIYEYCVSKFNESIKYINTKNKIKNYSITKKTRKQNNSKKISIVTPSFNQANFLEECIDSILSQNYPKLEYIIMDGGSTDGSKEIIKKYEKYLRYWQSKKDDGQYWAINAALQMTTGDIMSWLNSDDKLFPYTLKLMAELFSSDNNRHWITGLCNHIDANGKMTYLAKEAPKYSRFKYLCKEFSKPFIQQEGTFWSRQHWEKSDGYNNTTYTLAGDLELWTRFFRHDVLHVVNCPTGSFRKHSNQKSKLYYDKYIQEAEEIINQEIYNYERGKY